VASGWASPAKRNWGRIKSSAAELKEVCMDSGRLAVLLALWGIALSGCGCGRSPQPQTVALVVQGDLLPKTAVENLLKASPVVVHPNSGTEYSLLVVKPDPGVNYKILQVKPDPVVDYKILIVDPGTGQPVPELNPEVARAIAESLALRKQAKEGTD
jgi:hypothetical protein